MGRAICHRLLALSNLYGLGSALSRSCSGVAVVRDGSVPAPRHTGAKLCGSLCTGHHAARFNFRCLIDSACFGGASLTCAWAMSVQGLRSSASARPLAKPFVALVK